MLWLSIVKTLSIKKVIIAAAPAAANCKKMIVVTRVEMSPIKAAMQNEPQIRKNLTECNFRWQSNINDMMKKVHQKKSNTSTSY